MFYSLRGKIVYSGSSDIAIECGGVAYLCQCSMSTLSAAGSMGDETLIYTFMNVREGAIDLFGFADREELSCFKMLTSVSGVGPKVALSILSQMTPERFALCVASEDHKSLTAAPGVGGKIAQRIVLELRDKVSSTAVAKGISLPARGLAGGGNTGEAISALVVLGYSQSEAASAVGLLPADLPVEEMIKAGLKTLAGAR